MMPHFEWSTALPKQQSDVICLRLPWGTVRHFPVPARDPNNPTYQFMPWVRAVQRFHPVSMKLSGLDATIVIPDDVEG